MQKAVNQSFFTKFETFLTLKNKAGHLNTVTEQGTKNALGITLQYNLRFQEHFVLILLQEPISYLLRRLFTDCVTIFPDYITGSTSIMSNFAAQNQAYE